MGANECLMSKRWLIFVGFQQYLVFVYMLFGQDLISTSHVIRKEHNSRACAFFGICGIHCDLECGTFSINNIVALFNHKRTDSGFEKIWAIVDIFRSSLCYCILVDSVFLYYKTLYSCTNLLEIRFNHKWYFSMSWYCVSVMWVHAKLHQLFLTWFRYHLVISGVTGWRACLLTVSLRQ